MDDARGTGARLAELLAYDCWTLLEAEEVARVAWNGSHGPAVVPVNYAVADGALWFRTSPYSTLGREAGGQRVVVEVDRIDRSTRSGWSVVVSGVAELLGAEEVPDQVDVRVWPAGGRSLFVKVEPVEVTGRRLLPGTISS